MDILQLKNVSKSFRRSGLLFRNGELFKAIDNINLTVKKGEALGLLGRSGSGKSTIIKIMADIYKADSGSVYYQGKDIYKSDKTDYEIYRKNVQVVFQDPTNSLNPKLKIYDILADGIKKHITKNKSEIDDRLNELLKKVSLRYEHLLRYPHQFSGGQKQRISIARAVSLSPEIIIADEPLSMLDVSVQAQIVNLFHQLIDEGVTLVMISHNLAHIANLTKKSAVIDNSKIKHYDDTDIIIKKMTEANNDKNL